MLITSPHSLHHHPSHTHTHTLSLPITSHTTRISAKCSPKYLFETLLTLIVVGGGVNFVHIIVDHPGVPWGVWCRPADLSSHHQNVLRASPPATQSAVPDRAHGRHAHWRIVATPHHLAPVRRLPLPASDRAGRHPGGQGVAMQWHETEHENKGLPLACSSSIVALGPQSSPHQKKNRRQPATDIRRSTYYA